MLRSFLFAKIHGATVTAADLNYEGSITLASDLLEKAGLMPAEKVHVWDVTNGARLETYILEGERGSRDVTINGAAAHLIRPGDTVIISAFAQLDSREALTHVPTNVFMNPDNSVKEIRRERLPTG